MIRVVIESPLSAPDREGIERNKAYAIACARDSLRRGEAPYASHLFFDRPGLLDDLVPAEREAGMAAGFAWGEAAELTAVYADRGVSPGMREGIKRARARGAPVQFRWIEGETPSSVGGGGPWCGAESYWRYFCTRPRGHEGLHAAHVGGSSCVVDAWGDAR